MARLAAAGIRFYAYAFLNMGVAGVRACHGDIVAIFS